MLVVANGAAQNISGVINIYTPVTAIDRCENTITVGSSAGFNVGDRALIIQMKGAQIDQSNTAAYGDITSLGFAGNYEIGTIATITGNDIVFQNVMVNDYDVTGLVQLVRVPQYTDVTINATLTCDPWNGTVGGVLIFEASGTVTMNADIDVSGMGFRGGNKSLEVYNGCSSMDYFYDYASGWSAQKGEGITPNVPNADAGMGKLANGGGGGNHVNGGGGGGGNGGLGGNGGNQWNGCPIIDIGGRGGLAMTYSNAASRIFLGGGGGGGHQNDGSNYGSAGTNGGGIVLIDAGTIAGNGQQIISNGLDQTFLAGSDGSGGGGAGGTILLSTGTITGTLNANAVGGEGGSCSTTGHGTGAGGGGGAIWVSQGSVPGSVTTSVAGGPNGTLSDNTSYGAQPGQPGTVVTSLTVNEGTITFTPNPAPTVSNNGPICPGLEVTLSGPAIPGATYSWTGPNGFTSTDQNPSLPNASEAMEGTYQLIVTVMGCQSQPGTTDLVVNPVPYVNFTATTACVNTPTAFTDASNISSGSLDTYSWSFAGYGSSSDVNPTFAFPVAGTHQINLTIYSDNNCPHDTTLPVTVDPAPLSAFSAPAVCEGNPTVFTNGTSISQGTITSTTWDFDGFGNSNQTDPSFTFPVAGAHDVQLSSTSDQGCVHDTTISIFVNYAPDVDFTFMDGCLGTATNFTDASSITLGTLVSRDWDFNGYGSNTGLNPTFNFPIAGVHPVTLEVTSNSGCVHDTTIDVTVYPRPHVEFTATTVCEGQTTDFTDISNIATGTIASLAWDFAGEGTDVGANPSFTFTNIGQLPVTLTATSDQGCVHDTTIYVTVNPTPVADFDFNNTCLGLPAYFWNQSTIALGGTITDWSWSFGDPPTNGTSTDENPVYTYGTDGSFSVMLTVSTANGCSSDTTQDILVNVPPTANFTYNDGCEDTQIAFTNTSVNGGGTITTYQWDFGDFANIPALPNSTSSLPSPNFTYFTPGVYDVDLTVTDDNGCYGGLIQQVIIYPNPTASFTFDTACTGNATSFTDMSTVLGDVVDEWLWDFDYAGNTSTQQNPAFSYPQPGFYSVELTATTTNGCSHSTFRNIAVYATPEADFDLDNVCLNDSTSFVNLSEIDADSISLFIWDFGDATFSNDSSPTHLYAAEDTYTVQLIAESNQGCADTIIKQATVYPLPIANFSFDPDEGCKPLTVSFTDESTISSGSITNWGWNLGAGVTSQRFPTFTYTNDGVYDISLYVVSTYGCRDTVTQTDVITVFPKPTAKFAATPPVVDVIYPFVEFADESIGATTFDFSLGDGASSSQRNFTHEYPDTGHYTVVEIVENQYGCLDTAEMVVVVTPTFAFYVPNAFTPNDDQINDEFYGNGVGIIEWRMRIFNRWGEEIFWTMDYQNIFWDGTHMKTGEPVQNGIYQYDIVVRDYTGENHRYKGDVKLIR